MGLLWIVLVGFVAGVIARLLAPGPNKPAGFLLTTALGIFDFQGARRQRRQERPARELRLGRAFFGTQG